MRRSVFFLISLGLGVLAQGQTTSSNVGSPAMGVGTREADDTVRIIGTLPYSNQWTFERPSNYLYFNYDQQTLSSQAIHVSHFDSKYNSNKMNIFSLDYFSKLFDLADPLGDSFFRRFALWGRYKVGFGMQSGAVIDDNTSTTLPAEKSSLLVLIGQVQLNFAYNWSEWVQPYIGFDYKPYYFRNTSSMSSAESEGSSAMYGPALGVQLPILFSHRGSLLAEVHKDIVTASSNQIFAGQIGGDFGVGLSF